ncbi:outer membrane protein assembly factor BamB family protein [Thalassoroseus pseudoceratinae]|uniref:outer membrane protein assembly factor BamB family protein n=1 Tax=Thalassoroseus pseudoceratinae TaxID=2713176 RepID=UPI001422817C|nr:PQQ-binding-like beta-propeller repeat protein [Thalassoroseus pseudoceratinae]
MPRDVPPPPPERKPPDDDSWSDISGESSWELPAADIPDADRTGKEEFSSLYDEELVEADEESVEAEPERTRSRYDDLLDDDEIVSVEMESLDADESSDDELVFEDESVESLPTPKAMRAAKSEPKDEAATEDAAETATRREPVADRIRERFGSGRTRPGDHDVIRSPIVLALLGGAVICTLVAVTLWFLTNRNKSEHQYLAADQALQEGRYMQAVELFENFLVENPTDQRVADARIGIGRANILRQISGGAPDWQAGIDAIVDFRREYREFETYNDQKIDLQKWSSEIAEGAARDAVELKRRELIDVSREAFKLAQHFSPVDDQPDELAERLEKRWILAVDVADQRDAYEQAIQATETALAADPPQTMQALVARRNLLLEFPKLDGDSKLNRLLKQTLDAEKKLILRDNPDINPETRDPLQDAPGMVVLTEQTRTRASEQSDGQTVFAMGRGVLFGLDTVTGQPLWRRTVGQRSGFFPQSVPTAVPGLLIHDQRRGELVLLESRTGKLQWRIPLAEPSVSEPLVEGGHIFLPTMSGRLYKLDLESGRIIGRIHFSQSLIGPPILPRDSAALVVVGERAIAYTVTLQDFEVVATAYTGHAAGSLDSPPRGRQTDSVDVPAMPLGSLLLLAENQPNRRCQLRLYDLKNPGEEIPQVASETIQGHVTSPPLLRGNLLFVASGKNRVTAFAVTDDPDQPPLSRIAQQNIVGNQTRSAYLTATSSDQLWYAGNGLYRLDLSSGALSVVANIATDSVAAQPLQRSGDILFMGRHQAFNQSVLLSPYQIDSLTSNWGTTIGSRILAYTGDKTAAGFLNEDGRFFRLQQAELQSNERTKFDTNSTVTLPIPDGLKLPLMATAITEQKIAAVAGGESSTCWILDLGGQVSQTHTLSETPELAPIPMGEGFVLAMPNGRLQYINLDSSRPAVDDYKPKIETDEDNQPGEQSVVAWVHADRINDELLLALDTNSQLIQVQLRKQPSPHLYGIRTVQLDSLVAMPFVLQDNFLALTTIEGQLQLMDSQTLQPVGEIELPGAVSNELWSAKGWVFAETEASTLHAIAIGEQPKLAWSVSNDNTTEDVRLAGPPFVKGPHLWVTRRNGDLSIIELDIGKLRKTIPLHNELDSGPIQIGDQLYVYTVDGGLISLDGIEVD